MIKKILILIKMQNYSEIIKFQLSIQLNIITIIYLNKKSYHICSL